MNQGGQEYMYFVSSITLIDFIKVTAYLKITLYSFISYYSSTDGIQQKRHAINHPLSCPALFLSHFSRVFQRHLPQWLLYISVYWNSQLPYLGLVSHLAQISVSLIRKARNNVSCTHIHIIMYVYNNRKGAWTKGTLMLNNL